MKYLFRVAFSILFFCLGSLSSFSQFRTCLYNGQNCINTISTATPFVRIVPDARSGAMGDVALAISSDANAIHFNTSKLAFAKKDWGMGVSYTPWIRSLGLQDVFLVDLSAYKKLGKSGTLAWDLKYFSLGNHYGTLLRRTPNEYAYSVGYAHQISPSFAIGITPKFILTELGLGRFINNEALRTGMAGALDLSFTHTSQITTFSRVSELSIAGAISNIGTNKIKYSRETSGEFLPANLGIGAAWQIHFNPGSSLTIATDINKLLVPTPNEKDTDGIPGPDYKTKSIFNGIFSSFNDAPGGISEEFRELMLSFGMEYWHREKIVFRTGFFVEDKNKGNRKHFTFGLGGKYKSIGLNFSYLTSAYRHPRNPMDNTVRFSLVLDFPKKGES